MKRLNLLVSVLIVASVLAACGKPASKTATPVPTVTAEPTEAATQAAPLQVATAAPAAPPTTTPTPAVTTSAPTATPEPGPAVGGTLVFAQGYEVDTLDVHKSGRVYFVGSYLGASLIVRDPQTGEFLPYLAESWTAAEDGLSYEFKLRQDVKFHDGTPLTAHDYAWTFNRAKDPKTKSPTAGPSLTGLAIAEAVDDYTLRFRMAWPNSALIDTLSTPCYYQPLSQAYVEKMGDEYGRHPMGVGPFKFKEWITGEKIVLERNPDFTWGPEFTQGVPPYIETLEFRTMPEYSTQLAGLETGELDYVGLEIKDLERIQNSGQYQIFPVMNKGGGFQIAMNTTRPPLDDVRVRQAFNYAVNRAPLIQVATLGHATPLYGPLTPATLGYWPGVENMGYDYDLEHARALMAQAGYTPGDGGWLEKDGQRLTLDLKVASNWAADVKVAEILMEQFKALGVEVKLEQLEEGVLYDVLSGGDYHMSVESDLNWDNFGILFAMLHSSMVGAWNRVRVTDMDKMISDLTTAVGPEALEAASIALQKHVIEQAYYISLFAGTDYYALNQRVKGVLPGARWDLYLFDAYIETTTD